MKILVDFSGKSALILLRTLRRPLGFPRLPGCSQASARHPFGAFTYLPPGPFLSSGAFCLVGRMVLLPWYISV